MRRRRIGLCNSAECQIVRHPWEGLFSREPLGGEMERCAAPTVAIGPDPPTLRFRGGLRARETPYLLLVNISIANTTGRYAIDASNNRRAC
jgi:hypothetical protein